VHPGDLAGVFSDLEMTWLLYYASAATGQTVIPAAAVPYVRRRTCTPSRLDSGV